MTGRERAEAWLAQGRSRAGKRAAQRRGTGNGDAGAFPAALIPAQRDRVTAVDDRDA
ncbi:hypothetical protein [Sporichthya polymorpha]|uniref:hypothetical protein n=1 Tax=Sporichthya polymorpha TaxID=35751 RepID=UPI000376D4E2|nr:hypothetical protein [Sporichthya polymorpha]